MNKYVIIISGATATGKSGLVDKLAEQYLTQQLGAEIINADIGSFYTALTIGTAKPDWQSSKITHHLFDCLQKPENFTVVQFRTRVLELIQEIWARGNVAIIVGGSAFYIKSLFFKQHEIEGAEIWVHQLEQENTNSLVLWQELHQVDEKRAAQIHPHDRYRIIRALAIFKATGQKASEFDQVFDPIAPFYFVTCVRDRQELYNRIDARVLEMFKMGWLREVELLRRTEWEQFLYTKKIIGYDDLLKYLSNEQIEFIEVVKTIQQKTRNYAKRQIIFLNKLQRDIETNLQNGHYVGSVEEINLTLCDVGLYIKGLLNRISQIDLF